MGKAASRFHSLSLSIDGCSVQVGREGVLKMEGKLKGAVTPGKTAREQEHLLLTVNSAIGKGTEEKTFSYW